MSLLSYTEICGLIEQGIIQGASYDNVNSASLDITLGESFLVERMEMPSHVLKLNKKDTLPSVKVTGKSIILAPNEFILAQSKEIFNLPTHLSAEYKLKSSMARIGLEHLNAGWCDAGWNGSVLTLELKNMLRRHYIQLEVGDKIGQMVFFNHKPVPAEKSYAARGSYNGDKEVQGTKVLGATGNPRKLKVICKYCGFEAMIYETQLNDECPKCESRDTMLAVDGLRVDTDFPNEERIDIIGQNGNNGEHYNG
jgi:dCTP deaminase